MPRCVSVVAFGLAAVLAGASAEAQDRDRWAGPYVGVNIGYGFAQLDGGLTVFQPNSIMPYPTGPLNYSVDAEGPFAGLQFGINGPSGPFFAGIEFDIQTADITGTSQTSFAPRASSNSTTAPPPQSTGSRRCAPGSALPPATRFCMSLAAWPSATSSTTRNT